MINMNKREIKTLRRPFVKELFRGNKFNLAMSVLAALFGAASELVISWLIKEVADLISGECPYSFGTLLIVTGGAFALFLLGGALDWAFHSGFRAKAMKQYREYVFDRLIPWQVGFNYIPAYAVNTTEMWQSESFNITAIHNELLLASSAGYNSIRLFLPFIMEHYK